MSLWKGMLYTFPAVTFLAVLSFPSALQLYFVATGAFGAAQATLTSSDKFRRFAGITIPDRNQAKPDMSNIIRLLQEQQRAVGEAKNRSRSEMQSGQQGISFIDSTINSLKKKQSDARKSIEEMTRELQEKAGRGPEKRADGSVADPPRLSKKERQRADEYEKRRREEEDYKRQERNSIRKQGRGDRHERGSS